MQSGQRCSIAPGTAALCRKRSFPLALTRANDETFDKEMTVNSTARSRSYKHGNEKIAPAEQEDSFDGTVQSTEMKRVVLTMSNGARWDVGNPQSIFHAAGDAPPSRPDSLDAITSQDMTSESN